MNHDTAQRLTLTAGAVLLAIVALVSAMLPAARGYNPLLLDDVGHLITLIQLLLVLSGMSLWLTSYTERRYWYAVTLYLTSVGLLLALPFARGYYLPARPGNDLLVQLGYSRVIIDTGFVATSDWYPAAHLLSATLTMLGIPLRTSWLPLVLVHLAVFLLGLAVLSRRLSSTQMAALATLPGIPLLFGPYLDSLIPSIMSTCLLPLTLWLIIRTISRSKRTDAVLTFVFMALMIVYHPITAAMLLICYALFFIFDPDGDPTHTPAPVIAASVAYVMYLLRFRRFELTISDLVLRILAPSTTEEASRAGATAAASNLSGQPIGRILNLALSHYGPLFLYFGLGSLGVLVFIVLWHFRGEELHSRAISLFVTGGLIGIALLVIDINVRAPYRATKLLIVAAAVVVALILIRSRETSQPWAEYMVVAVILIAAVGSVGTVFSTSAHITESNLVGLGWTVDYQESDDAIAAAGISYDMISFKYGTQENRAWEISLASAPSYSANASFVISTPRAQEEYFRLSRAEWARHTTLNETMLSRLNVTRQRVYDNGGYTIWH